MEAFPKYSPLTNAGILLDEGLPMLALNRLISCTEKSDQYGRTLAACYLRFAEQQQRLENWWGAYRSIRLMSEQESTRRHLDEHNAATRRAMARQIERHHRDRISIHPTCTDHLILAALYHHEKQDRQAVQALREAKRLAQTAAEHKAVAKTAQLIHRQSE